MRSKLQFLLFYLATIVIASWVISIFYPQVMPLAGIHLQLDRDDIEDRRQEIMAYLGMQPDNFVSSIRMMQDHKLLRQAQSELGLSESIAASRSGLSAYYWEVELEPADHRKKLRLNTSNTGPPEKDADLVTEMEMHFELNGDLRYLSREIPDTLQLQPLMPHQARRQAEDLIRLYTAYSHLVPDSAFPAGPDQPPIPPPRPREDEPLEANRQGQIGFDFSWEYDTPQLAGKTPIIVRMRGDQILEYQARHQVPPMYMTELMGPFQQAINGVIYALIAIITVVMALKRWGASEMDFRLGIFLGIISAISFGINLYMQIGGLSGLQLLFVLVFSGLFTGGALIFVWAVAESIGREVWRDKFVSIDLIRNGYLLHSQIGKGIIRGISLGFAIYALWLINVRIAASLTDINLVPKDPNILHFYTVYTPALQIINQILFSGLYVLAAYYILGLSMVKRLPVKTWIIFPVYIFLVALTFVGHLEPMPISLVIEYLTMLSLVLVLTRYDVLTTFLSLTTYAGLESATALFMADNGGMFFAGISCCIMIGLLIFYGMATLFTGDRLSDFDRIAPVYVRNISERQRLTRELEIARDVQMSFLPARNPSIARLDIASRCEPALEVGGDYYDFIELGDTHLGVTIGDVSGKGTQAAFYMTLAKGFLRALAEVSVPPAQVMSRMNRLFYDNVKRGVFISLIYGVIDIAANRMLLARAGHNPAMLLRDGSTRPEWIYPRGLALGMEKGEKFDLLIQESVLELNENDIVVLYTDGLTEAFNRHKQEFGEERLAASLSKHAKKPAEQILQGIFADIEAFAGREQQHDDMTLVIVKMSTQSK